MFNYVSTLRGMTKGRAQYTMQVRSFERGRLLLLCRRGCCCCALGSQRVGAGCAGAGLDPAFGTAPSSSSRSRSGQVAAMLSSPACLRPTIPCSPAAGKLHGCPQPHPGEDCGRGQGQGGGVNRTVKGPRTRRRRGRAKRRASDVLGPARPPPPCSPRSARILFLPFRVLCSPPPPDSPSPRHDAAPLTILYATTCLPPLSPAAARRPIGLPLAHFPSALPHLIRTLVGSSFEWAAPLLQSPARRWGAPQL